MWTRQSINAEQTSALAQSAECWVHTTVSSHVKYIVFFNQYVMISIHGALEPSLQTLEYCFFGQNQHFLHSNIDSQIEHFTQKVERCKTKVYFKQHKGNIQKVLESDWLDLKSCYRSFLTHFLHSLCHLTNLAWLTKINVLSQNRYISPFFSEGLFVQTKWNHGNRGSRIKSWLMEPDDFGFSMTTKNTRIQFNPDT